MKRFSNPGLLKLPNCAELTETGRCKLFNTYSCKGYVCKFKKTAAELRNINSKIYKRLASLSTSQQMHISKKYFGGKKPWSSEG